MIQAPVPFHSLTTEDLVQLAWGLDALLDGDLEEGAEGIDELLPRDVLDRAQVEIGHLELPDLLAEAAFELSRRHPETVGASLAAWHAWNHRSLIWREALIEGADVEAANAATRAA